MYEQSNLFMHQHHESSVIVDSVDRRERNEKCSCFSGFQNATRLVEMPDGWVRI